jgi:predicted porin
MKKSLVALAALAATSVFAQSSVTLSGGFSMGLRAAQSFSSTTGALDATSGGDAKGLHRAIAPVNNDSSNMLQFAVSEDLGGGMAASGVVQLRVNEGSGLKGASQLAIQSTGDTYVQLAGGFGTLRLGHWSVASHAGWNAFGSRTVSNLATGVANLGTNLVAYTTPNVSGFTATAAYAVNPTTLVGADGSLLMVNYAAGPLAVRAQIARPNSATAARPDGYGLAASYDFGVAKIFATSFTGQAMATATSTSTVDRSGFHVSGQVPLGALTLRAGVMNQSKDTTANFLDRRSAGVDYALSKRTTLIADFVQQKQAATAANKVNTYFMGVAHTF